MKLSREFSPRKDKMLSFVNKMVRQYKIENPIKNNEANATKLILSLSSSSRTIANSNFPDAIFARSNEKDIYNVSVPKSSSE